MTEQSLSAAGSRATKTADQSDNRAPDGADKADSTNGPDSTNRPDSTDTSEGPSDTPEGASDIGLAATNVPDGWPAIPQPIAAGDERRKLMRDMVLRALV